MKRIAYRNGSEQENDLWVLGGSSYDEPRIAEEIFHIYQRSNGGLSGAWVNLKPFGFTADLVALL